MAKVSCRFDDGSTFVHEGSAQSTTTDGKMRTTGQGRFTGSTGRFAGITGTTSSESRSL